MEAVIAKQNDVIASLSDYCKEIIKANETSEEVAKSNLTFLLRLLYEASQQNSGKKKNSYTYNDDIYMYCSYVYLTAGRKFYEDMHVMLEGALPHISNVKKYVAETRESVLEGVLRCSELKEYLLSHKLPLKVWLSEDGTRVISKFKYDIKTNQIVGPVLPLSDSTGNPIVNSYPATSAALIAKHVMLGALSSTAYLIMAQPLCKGASPFCLQIFGTNNMFTSELVVKRWGTTITELRKLDIEVAGISADGDPKLLKAMQSIAFPLCPFVPSSLSDFYFADTSSSITMIQDTIHLLNKFKNRLCKGSIILPMGKFVASLSHLKIIVKNVSKSEHGLTEYDLSKEDKMNFDATMKMCSNRVVKAIKENVPAANATLVYLDLMKKIECAFLEENLDPLERVYNMWYSVGFTRIWKEWIKTSKSYTLGNNFITTNCYVSLELNAHGIVHVLRNLRDAKCDHLFLPLLMSSQACESCFRKARSLTTTEATVINFSILEFLQKMKRIEFLLHFRSKMEGKLKFARDRRVSLISSGSSECPVVRVEPLPCDIEIHETIVKALNDAKTTAKNLGMVAVPCGVHNYLSRELDLSDVSDSNSDDACTPSNDANDDDDDDDDIPLDVLAMFPDLSNVTASSDCEEFPDIISPTSRFVIVRGQAGNLVTIPKSTLIWSLQTQGPRVSVDRNQRFRAQVLSKYKQNSRSDQLSLSVNDTVQIGDFCLFKNRSSFKIGQVLGFKYLSGARSSYTLDSAPTKAPEKGARGLEVLCTWYQLHPNTGNLTAATHGPKFSSLNLNLYKSTLPYPHVENGGVVLSSSLVAELKLMLK